MDRANPRKYNTANNLDDQIILNEYFPNYSKIYPMFFNMTLWVTVAADSYQFD